MAETTPPLLVLIQAPLPVRGDAAAGPLPTPIIGARLAATVGHRSDGEGFLYLGSGEFVDLDGRRIDKVLAIPPKG